MQRKPHRIVRRKKIVRHIRRRAPVKTPELEPAPEPANRGYDTYSLIFGYDFGNEPIDR